MDNHYFKIVNRNTDMRTSTLFNSVLAVVLIAATACITNQENSKPAASDKFLGLSDIHFNPFYDPSLIRDLIKTDAASWDTVFAKSSIKDDYGYYGWSGQFWDTGYPLFSSTLAAVKAANPNPEFITINGDFLAHNFEPTFQSTAGTTDLKALQDFTVKTMDYIVGAISKTFPGTPIFPTLGNNDAFCGDYEIRTPGSFLSRTAPLFLKNLHGNVDKTAFNKTYNDGGYFVASNPKNPNHKIISLNTVMLSPKHYRRTDFCGSVPDSTISRANADAQFTWLENQLKSAKTNNHKVWLMYHIPPGFDSWSTNSHNKGLPTSQCQNTVPSSFYDLDYNAKYLKLVKRYSSVIAAQLGGHTHMDNFMVINGDSNPESFVHIQPSITPINGNNPGFIEYTFDNSAVLKNYEVHGFNNVETVTSPDWKAEYTFSKVYGENELTAGSLTRIYKNFLTDTLARERYIEYYVVEDSANVAIDPADWKYYYCAFGNQTVKQYNKCVCNMSN